MKILYLAHRIPYPPNKGDKIRSFNQIKFLASRHELNLICLVDDPQDLPGADKLRLLCHRVHVCGYKQFQAKLKGLVSLLKGSSISSGYFYHAAIQRVFDQWITDSEYDAIICFSSPMAEYLFKSKSLNLSGQPEHDKRPQLIMDFCDVDSDKWLQYAHNAKFPINAIYRIENKRLASYERKVYQVFDHSLLVSDKEEELFRQVCPDTDKVTVVRNGVDFDYFCPNTIKEKGSYTIDEAQDPPKKNGHYATGPTIVFTGAMDYHANIDGVNWFCLEVLPKIQEKFPSLKFLIVGSNPVAAVQNLTRLPGVEVTGFVDDIREYYRIADLCVVPLRLARGVQNKVLEAMAMGKAVVTTSRANDGVQAYDGTHLLIADSAEEFSGSIVKLLSNSALSEQIASNARDFIVHHYDWQKNMAGLLSLIQEQGMPAIKTTQDKGVDNNSTVCHSRNGKIVEGLS